MNFELSNPYLQGGSKLHQPPKRGETGGRGLRKHGMTAGALVLLGPHCLGPVHSAERDAVISSSRKFSRLDELPHCWLGQLLDQYSVTRYCKTDFKCGAHMALGLGFFCGFGGMYYSAGV